MVLAAGRGERMRPLTDSLPKPMLAVGGKPLIVWHLERFAAWGIEEVVINHAHLGHVLVASLGDGSQWGLSIRYSAESCALETAGGIAQALHLLGDAPFLVVNGDVFCDLDADAVRAARNRLTGSDTLAHLWLVDNPQHKPVGDFTLCADGILLPQPDAGGGQAMTFSGVGMYRPTLFEACARGEKAALAPLLRAAMSAQRVTGQHLPGRWVDVGTPQRLVELDRELQASN
jgi:MurNAc alpha-1-phosphate uridylyltransferase